MRSCVPGRLTRRALPLFGTERQLHHVTHSERHECEYFPQLRHTGRVSPMDGRRMLGPLRARAPWVLSGLLLQAAGAGGVAAYVWLNVRRQGLGGHLSAATIQLAWHSEVHTRQGLAVLATGAVIYAVGSVFMARPYLTRPVMLFVAVPAAAVAGLLVLGVLALLVTLLIAALADGDLGIDLDFSGDRGRPKRPRRQ